MTLADILPSLRSSLPPRLHERHWPSTMRRRGHAELRVGGVSLSRLAADYGTPLQVLDETDVRQCCAEYVRAFGPAGASYSAKAGMTTVSGRWIAQSGLGCYVVSAQQLAAALAAGFPPEKLVLAGPAKSVAALEAAFACGAAVVAGSVGEVVALGRRAPGGQRVLVRVLASGQRCPRTGLRLGSSLALQAVAAVQDAPNLRLAGLDCSLGHDLARFGAFERCLREAVAFAAVARARHRAVIDVINLGGGQAAACRGGSDGLPVPVFADRLRAVARVNAERYGLAVPAVRVSPGRALTARAGVTLYRVQRVTRAADDCLHVDIDGVLPQCPGDAVCGAEGHATELVGRAPGAGPEPAVLTSDGVDIRAGAVAVRVPGDVTAGDLLVLAGTGAYHTAGDPVVGRPAVVSVAGGLAGVLQRRVTVTDLLARSR